MWTERSSLTSLSLVSSSIRWKPKNLTDSFKKLYKAVSWSLFSMNSQGLQETCQWCSFIKLVNLVKAQFPHLQNGYENNYYLVTLKWTLSKAIEPNFLAKCFHKCSTISTTSLRSPNWQMIFSPLYLQFTSSIPACLLTGKKSQTPSNREQM